LPPIGMLADRWGLDFVLTALALIASTLSLAVWALFARAHEGRS
jgi:hypothetical protein